MTAEVEPIRPGVPAAAETAATRDTFAEGLASFAARYGHPPTGAAWVIFDAEGNTTNGWLIEGQLRQTLAFCGARLTAEALTP